MTIDANATTTTLTTHGTWYQVTAGWAAGDLNGFTFTTSDALTCGSAGDYETIAAVSAKSSSSNQQLLFAIAKNGVIITDHIIETKYDNNTDIQAGTVSGIIKGVQIGDIFTLWCQNPNTDSMTTTVTYCNFNVFALTGVQGATGAIGPLSRNVALVTAATGAPGQRVSTRFLSARVPSLCSYRQRLATLISTRFRTQLPEQ